MWSNNTPTSDIGQNGHSLVKSRWAAARDFPRIPYLSPNLTLITWNPSNSTPQFYRILIDSAQCTDGTITWHGAWCLNFAKSKECAIVLVECAIDFSWNVKGVRINTLKCYVIEIGKIDSLQASNKYKITVWRVCMHFWQIKCTEPPYSVKAGNKLLCTMRLPD